MQTFKHLQTFKIICYQVASRLLALATTATMKSGVNDSISGVTCSRPAVGLANAADKIQ